MSKQPFKKHIKPPTSFQAKKIKWTRKTRERAFVTAKPKQLERNKS